ncbi:MAG: QueT transporter family protein [Clostridiales bacterium]|jgi:uncharacterized membrane protein|nr:QueT transporter family protein [Clostridiales bacterium]
MGLRNNQRQVLRLAVAALTAAAYVALTLGLSFISFGSIQFRIAEIMNLMAFIDPIYGAGVVLGCLISNMFSPFGLVDAAIGTLCTAAAVFAISRTKNLLAASFWPMLANTPVALFIAYATHTNIFYNILTVWIGEIVVVACLGYPLFRVLMSSKRVMSMLGQIKTAKNGES